MLRPALSFAAAATIGALAAVLGIPRALPIAARVPSSQPAAGITTPVQTLDAGPHHLPDWVQTRQAAPLWSGSDKHAVQFTQLPAWTFLKVIGAGVDRLEVQFDGDSNSRQPGPGWVMVSDVQPSDPSGRWLRNHRASQLFADPASLAPMVAVPQWSWMLRVDDVSTNGRHRFASTPAPLHQCWVKAGSLGTTSDRLVRRPRASGRATTSPGL